MKKTAKTNCWSTIGVWGSRSEKCAELEKYIHCRNCPIFSDIGRSVFEKSAPSGYLTQWRKEISRPKERYNSKVKSVLVFRSGSEWFGLQAKILSEVADNRRIHRIPRNKNSAICGIVNINGVIKVCYSLAEILEISPASDSPESASKPIKRLIVISVGLNDYVLLADEIQGLHWYSDDELQSIPSTISDKTAHLLLGSIIQEKNNVAVFNTDNLQQMLEAVTI